MTDLKLIALDAEDLSVVASHLQDAVVQVGDMAYVKGERRFAAILNRFDWVEALSRTGTSKTPFHRRRAAIRVERVRAARLTGIDLAAKRAVLSLLTIDFAAAAPDDPSGTVTLLFAGGGAIQLDVECIEVELRDLGAAWRARAKPEHPVED